MQNDKMLKYPNTTRENKPILHNRNLRIINNSSSNNSTSNNFFQMKKLKIKKNDKNQKTNLELVKKNIFMKLKNNLKKYDSSLRKVYIKTINDIIYDEKKHIVSLFKDYLFWDENSDFLKRFYKVHESRDRMPRISAYYQTYTLIKPIYFKLECYRLLSKNLKRHKKRLEILEEKLGNSKNNNQQNKQMNANNAENCKRNKNNSDEFSKIVKSHFMHTENLSEINNDNKINKNQNNVNLKNKNLFNDIDNKNLSNFLAEKGKGDAEFIFYEESKDNNNKNSHENNFKTIGIRKMIKLNDAGNKYDIQKLHLDEEDKKNKKIFEKEEEFVSNIKINNSYSFLELQNLINLYDKKNDDISNAAIKKNKISDKEQLSKRNNVANKNSANVKANYNSIKKLSYNLNQKNNNNNKVITTSYKNKAELHNNIIHKYAYNKNEEVENTQHSLFLEDYSIIQLDDKEIKSQTFSHNYLNMPVNEEHSFFTVNQEQSIISRNNDNRSDITLESIEETKRIQSGKGNVFTKNSKEKEKEVSAKAISTNLKQQPAKEKKKMNIPTLNLQYINLINSKNTLNSKAEKKQSDPIIIKNPQASESGKLSEPIKKDSKNINRNINNINQSSKELKKQNSESANEPKLTSKNKNIIKNEKINIKKNNNNNEPSDSKSERELESKTNQNFKIIENMIKSIKMNNIDGLINIINSKSKNKNKALTSREKDRGDILILQNIYSRNLNKNKLNDQKCASINTNENKTQSDNYKSNNIEKSKINEFSDTNNIYKNILGKIKSAEVHSSNENPEETEENNKLEINTVTEPNVSKNDMKANKKITIKNSVSINNNNINFLSSKDDKKKENIPNKDLMTDLNIKNNYNTNRNSINTGSNKNNIIGVNKIQVSNSNKLNNNFNSNNNNNPSSIYNINLNLNLNLNLKMDKLKSTESNEIANATSKNPNCRNISESNNNNNQTSNTSRNILNKENRILIKKASEEDNYKNSKYPKQQAELIVFEPSSLTDRHKKDYFNFEELKLKTNLNERENENNYINTEDYAKNNQKQFEKINFVNKFSSKVTEKNPYISNNNNLVNSNNFQNKFNIPHNLSRNIYNTNNLKQKLKAEEDDTGQNNNVKNPTNNNIINDNYNDNHNSNFVNKIIEEEKKSRHVQNNNLANANLFLNNNFINNNNQNNVNSNSNNFNSNTDKYKNTLSSKLRLTQPLTQRILEAGSKNTININHNQKSDTTKNLNLEKKIIFKSEKNRITNPLFNQNTNRLYNSNNSGNNNNNNNNLICNINLKLPSSSGNRNKPKISLNNLAKNINSNYNSDKGNYVKNLSERENINKLNTNSNFFTSIDVNNSNNQFSKGENNKQNYESINSNNNNFNDASLKCPGLINDESYLRIIQNTEKKFNSISRNFNLKNLILFNDPTNKNKNSNTISLKQMDSYAKINFNNNTARNNSASNNFYFENYLVNNKNENSGLFIESNDNFNLKNNENGNKQNFIAVEKIKFVNSNSRNIRNNDFQNKKQNFAVHKPVITNYNDRSFPFSIENSLSKLKKSNNDSGTKKLNDNDSENYSLLKNLNEINLFASGDFGNKLKNNSNNLIINQNNYKQRIKIPVLNLKDINKNIKTPDHREIDKKGNLTSGRNNKNSINDFLKKNVNIAINAKEYLTSRNEKNNNSNKQELINVELNSNKVDNKNALIKNNLKMVLDSKNKANSNSNRNLINNFNMKK